MRRLARPSLTAHPVGWLQLGASGSIDGKQRLIVKGRFQPKSIENVLRKYMIEYVLCSLCKSNDTGAAPPGQRACQLTRSVRCAC